MIKKVEAMQAFIVELSPVLREKLNAYCQAQSLREEAFIEQAVLERLEQEERIEQCCCNWEAILQGKTLMRRGS